MQTSFISGLQSTGHWGTGTFNIVSKDEEGSYGRASDGSALPDLEKAAQYFVDHDFNLIVAAGLAAINAVYTVLNQPGAPNIPAIGMLGRLPQTSADPG
jgi:hypothetical protein